MPVQEWTARRAAHEVRVDALTADHRARAGRPHPVEDFLFTYYSHRPSRLRRWSPGAGVELEGYDGPQAWLDVPDQVRATAAWVVDLLDRTAARPVQLGCFGLHEWAMVYRDVPRHEGLPLRLGEQGTAAVVEAQPLRCSHHDAFRFFTPAARPLNAMQPRREDQRELEQGGCLHANMDLYKWSYKLSPWVPAELVADCFDLARDARQVDMRASPYDLRPLGLTPIPIETPAGRADYVRAQRDLMVRGQPLRAEILRCCRSLVPGPDAKSP